MGLLERHLVHETPHPVLSWLERLHDRVLGLVEMLRRVLVLRRIAASHVSADQTETQMHPGIACLQAVFAALRARRNIPDLAEMGADFLRRLLLSHPDKYMQVSRFFKQPRDRNTAGGRGDVLPGGCIRVLLNGRESWFTIRGADDLIARSRMSSSMLMESCPES
jgi:hypothetical protein